MAIFRFLTSFFKVFIKVVLFVKMALFAVIFLNKLFLEIKKRMETANE